MGRTVALLSMLRRGCRGVALIPMTSLPPTKQDDDDDEFAPDNVTFAPKDVTPIDFNPKVGVQGLGYRGLDPGLALQGRGAREHFNLFDPQSNARSQLFGGPERDGRRRGVAGQVVSLRPAFSCWVWAGLGQQDTPFAFHPQAFGVGALEDEDEDIYHRESMSKYDTVLGGEEPGDGLFGWTAPEMYSRKKGLSDPPSPFLPA